MKSPPQTPHVQDRPSGLRMRSHRQGVERRRRSSQRPASAPARTTDEDRMPREEEPHVVSALLQSTLAAGGYRVVGIGGANRPSRRAQDARRVRTSACMPRQQEARRRGRFPPAQEGNQARAGDRHRMLRTDEGRQRTRAATLPGAPALGWVEPGPRCVRPSVYACTISSPRSRSASTSCNRPNANHARQRGQPAEVNERVANAHQNRQAKVAAKKAMGSIRHPQRNQVQRTSCQRRRSRITTRSGYSPRLRSPACCRRVRGRSRADRRIET